ncbi:pumilio homolog 23-like [Nicotiana sylvestris]|uniref:pumilio homolog 23-like n=1 Tax=Nicotiana sylvestris TaxID=4096 RepID=UPI00388C6C5A
MLNAANEDISKLQTNQYSSLVLQYVNVQKIIKTTMEIGNTNCLILLAGNEQELLHLIRELIQIYVTSITSLEEHHVLAASKDPSGSRVIESFRNSNISAKQKWKLVAKLRGHFGELSVHPFGSFTVEKCFTASNLSLRETILSEMLPLQSELSKTKQGPYLLRKLDIDGYARQPDQWKSRQASQQSALKEFFATFGPTKTKSLVKENFLADTHSKPKQEKLKDIRKEIKTTLASSKTSNTPFLANQVSKKVKRSKDEKKRHTRDGQ